MALSSNLAFSEQLLQEFDNEDSKLIKIIISEDKTTYQFANATEESDFDIAISKLLEPETACYLIFKHSENWMVICYVPPNTERSFRFLYPIGSNAVRERFGGEKITHVITVNDASELTWSNIHQQYFDTSDHSELLSKRENEMLEIRRMEASEMKARIKDDEDNQKSFYGIGFKFDTSAMDAIDEFVGSAKGCCGKSIPCNFCVLTLDLENETISAVALPEFDEKSVPTSHATYCLRNYKENIIFALCIPNEGKLNAKELMMYATGKAGVIATLAASGINVTPGFNLRIDCGSDISDNELESRLSPKTEENDTSGTFVKKVRGPGRRR